MMTMIIDRLTALGDDVSFSICGNTIFATLEDFIGFDSRWREIEREFDNPDAVEDFIEWCEDASNDYTSDMVTDYHFGDIVLWLGYASSDI